MSAPLFQFSVNRYGKDKDWNYELLASKYEDRGGSLWDVVHHIKQGHALCGGLLGGQRREKANIIGTNWILLDIDNSGIQLDENGNQVKGPEGKLLKIYKHQMTLEEALAHPFIQQYCALIYTSASHQPDWHKFRLVFLLPQYVSDVNTIEMLVQFLMERLPHDPVCKDASRVFFGNTKAEIPLFNPQAYLPLDWMEQAIAFAAINQLQREKQRQERERRRQQVWRQLEARGTSKEDIDTLVLDALRFIPPREPGSGNYLDCRTVLMALHSHFGEAEAERIAEVWSPSIPGTTWNISKKLRSFKRSGVTIASLFWIAQQYGWRFPKRNSRDSQEPNPKVYAQFETEQAEQERIERVEEEVRGNRQLEQFLQRLMPKRFRYELPTPKTSPEVLRYVPGHLPQQSYGKKFPKILYQVEQLPQLLAEARNKGWKDILDSSGTGMGKSYRYAAMKRSMLGADDNGRVWLLSRNHRNPTTPPAENNYADMPVRTRTGFVEDPSRKTATGRSYLRYPTPKEAFGMHAGNCHMTDPIHASAAKGIDSATQEAQMNPFCTILCQHKNYCQESSGPGYGYRHERQKFFENAHQIRSSIDSLPEPSNYQYGQDVAVLDEALLQLKPVRTFKADLKDFAAQWDELEYQLPQVANQLSSLKTALAPLVRGFEVPYHGLNHEQLMSLLPPVPEGFTAQLRAIEQAMKVDIASLAGEIPDTVSTQQDSKEIISLKAKIQRRSQRLEELRVQLFELQGTEIEDELEAAGHQLSLGVEFQEFKYTKDEAKKLLERLQKLPDKIAEIEAEVAQLQADLKQQERDRQTVKNFNRRQYQEAKQSIEDKIEALPNQWLVPFLEVWSGQRKGAIRIDRFGLKLTMLDDRHNSILSNIKARYYLDATATPQILTLYRQIPVGQILWIEQEQAPVKNLDFIWVTGMGLAGKRRSESCDERLKILYAALKQKHPNLATFDWKSKKEVLDADGHYFSDSTRGTNEFIDRTAIAAIGLPMPDVASFYDVWLTTKIDESLSFDDFYRLLVDSEIIQEVGRLRANRRPDEKLNFYLIGDTEKCKIANYQPPAQLKPQRVELRDFCPAAASRSEQAWLGIWEVIQHWWTEHGELPTQEEVSEQTGINRSWISKLAAQFVGGWKCLKQVIQSLVNPPYNRQNLIEPLFEDIEWIAATYLPAVTQDRSLEVAQVLDALIQIYGWRGWIQILSQTSQALRLNLIAALFRDARS